MSGIACFATTEVWTGWPCRVSVAITTTDHVPTAALAQRTSWLPFGFSHETCGAVFDVDGDGGVDLIGRARGQMFGLGSVLLNDGRGRFRLGGPIEGGELTPLRASLDVDFDGDTDLVVADLSGRRFRILYNLVRHLHAPYAPRLGDAYVLEFYSRSGDAPAAGTAWPVGSLGRDGQHVAGVGRLGLATDTWFPLPPVAIPQPDGVASLTMTVPLDPRLIGLSRYFQVAMVGPGGQVALTNVLAETVID